MGFSGGSVGKESVRNAGDPSLIPGLGRPWRRKWQPTLYSCLKNSMANYSPWGHKESDMTEQLTPQQKEFYLNKKCVCCFSWASRETNHQAPWKTMVTWYHKKKKKNKTNSLEDKLKVI